MGPEESGPNEMEEILAEHPAVMAEIDQMLADQDTARQWHRLPTIHLRFTGRTQI